MIHAILMWFAMATPMAHSLVTRRRDPLPPTTALIHTYMAEAAATPDAPASLLLAIAYRETRMTRVYRPGPGQCGVTQIETYADRDLCLRLADSPALAYAAAARHLGEWSAFCKANGRLDRGCAMTGYGRGTRAALGRVPRWARTRLQLARALERDGRRVGHPGRLEGVVGRQTVVVRPVGVPGPPPPATTAMGSLRAGPGLRVGTLCPAPPVAGSAGPNDADADHAPL